MSYKLSGLIMRKVSIICLALSLIVVLSSFSQAASYTNVTATLTDTGGTIWANGSYRVELIPPFGNPATPTNQGTPTTGPFAGFLNGSGALAVTLDDNIAVTPSGTTWKFTLCPNATTTICSVSIQVVHGVSMNLSTSISADLNPVSVSASPTIYRAYTDAEVSGGQGSVYWRVTDNTLRGCSVAICNGASWVNIGGGGGGCAEGVCIQNFPVGNQTIAGSHTFSVTNGTFNVNGPGVLNVFGFPSLVNIKPNDESSWALTLGNASMSSGFAAQVLNNGDTILQTVNVGGGGSGNQLIFRADGSNIRIGHNNNTGFAVDTAGNVLVGGSGGGASGVFLGLDGVGGARFDSNVLNNATATLLATNVRGTSTFQFPNLATSDLQVASYTLLAEVAVPANATTTCLTGAFARDTGFLYSCTAANTWKRVAIATW